MTAYSKDKRSINSILNKNGEIELLIEDNRLSLLPAEGYLYDEDIPIQVSFVKCNEDIIE